MDKNNSTFDEKTQQELNHYVYMLLDPKDNNKPFYVGKGKGNRVFNHLTRALTDKDTSNAKYDKIIEINQRGQTVDHIIVRHGLTQSEAFEIEAALIDTFVFCGLSLSNIVGGHNSFERGLMTSDKIIRLYSAGRLNKIESNCILININKNYKDGNDLEAIYEATKGTWTISKDKLSQLKYVLSEYNGFVLEVFEVEEWKESPRGFGPNAKKYGQTKIGYEFDRKGKRAPDEIRNLYINKSIAHIKKRGAASPIRYNL